MGGAPDWPREWLDRSPFEDYLVPGLVLVVVVGGSMSVAALVGVVAGGEWMAFSGLVAALILLDWIVVQVAIIGYVSFLQPLFFATGLVVLVLAWHLQRHSS